MSATTSACPAPFPLPGEGSLAAPTDNTKWLDGAPVNVAPAARAGGADATTVCGTLDTFAAFDAVAAGLEAELVGPESSGAGDVALVTEDSVGPQLGAVGLARACDTALPCPVDVTATPKPRLDATGPPNSITARREPTATTPLIALIAAVRLRRRRDRLGITTAYPPRGLQSRGCTADNSKWLPLPPSLVAAKSLTLVPCERSERARALVALPGEGVVS